MAATESGAPAAAPPTAPPKLSRRQQRRAAKALARRGNGSEIAPPVVVPGLRELLFKDLRPSELPSNFRKDLKQLYRFYLDEERRAQLAAMGRVRRAFKIVGWTLKSLLAKLSPGRRLALFASLVMVVMGRLDIQDIHVNLRFWSYFVLLMVLMLEMKDKLLARDEIAIARQVQLALLPGKHPQPEGWSLWSYMRPANDVGADLVDYIRLDDGHLGIVLGDVAGKGLGAALLTAKLQATLRALIPTCATLSGLGAQMNDILHQDGIDNRFVTMFYLDLDPATGRLRYLNAGHNPAYVLRPGRTEALQASAIPLGMMEGTTYEEGEITVAPGELLAIYSDGLTEARNAADEEFGAERLQALLPRVRGLSAEDGVRLIINEVNHFLAGERPHDDLSLVILSRPDGAPGVLPPPRVTSPTSR